MLLLEMKNLHMMNLKFLIIVFLLISSTPISAADWRYGTVRASDNKQVDIDYQSIRQESGYIIFEVRMPPEKKLLSLFSTKKFERYSYGVECSSKKGKWLYAADEDKNGAVEVKFLRTLEDAKAEDIPAGTMLSEVQIKLCNEINKIQTNNPPQPSSQAEKEEKSLPKSVGKSILAPNGIVADEWIAITESAGVNYYAKKQSLERQGDNVLFITGRDLGTEKQSTTGKNYKYEIELSIIDCINSMYSSRDSERFDSSGVYTETIKPTKAQTTPHKIVSELGLMYKNLMCGIDDNNKNAAQSNGKESEKAKSNYATGTAWQISKTHLVTAYHVVQDVSSIAIMIKDDDIRNASIVTYDESNDLAILKIDGAPLQTSSIGISNSPAKIGSSIAVLGFPLPELLGTKLQANSGEVSSIHGIRNDPRFYRITANVQGGNSGGPVLNQYGEAIGVVSSKLHDIETLKQQGELPQNINFAVKNHYLKALMESARIKSAKVERKLKPIDEVIEDMRDSVFLVVTETKNLR